MNDKRQPRRPQRPASSDAVQPSRLVAYEVLHAVDADEAYANLLLPHAIAKAKLSTADAALATELSYGTLRWRGFYDRVIEIAANRPAADVDEPVRNVLRLGIHQLLATRVAHHAAVNESVALTHRVASRSATGFVNGVLRRVSRDDAQTWHERVAETATDDADARALATSHPAWIVRAFRQALAAEGRESELDELLAADNAAPRVNMVALPGIAERPAAAAPDRYSPVGFVLEHGDPDASVRSSAGALRVQDEGSQLAALVLSRAMPVAQGERWLDLCAGPGGKTALLGAEAAVHGATVLANELIPARAELVRRAVDPVASTVDVVTGDGRDLGQQHPHSFDRVLVDAPCTGLGALRRRPEARWRKKPKDVGELSALQAQLLRSALAAVKPGGIVAYVTCSPHLGETRAIVGDAIRNSHGAVTALDTPAVLRGIVGDIDLGTPDPGRTPAISHVQLWPHRHGTDAMYIVLLQTAER